MRSIVKVTCGQSFPSSRQFQTEMPYTLQITHFKVFCPSNGVGHSLEFAHFVVPLQTAGRRQITLKVNVDISTVLHCVQSSVKQAGIIQVLTFQFLLHHMSFSSVHIMQKYAQVCYVFVEVTARHVFSPSASVYAGKRGIFRREWKIKR